MSTTHDPTHAGPVTDHPHADLIRGLRDLADFLEQHPELPELRAQAWISQYRDGRTDPRGDLEALAQALGDRAREDYNGERVRIEGTFGSLRVYAEAHVREVRGEPPAPLTYEPIIPANGSRS